MIERERRLLPTILLALQPRGKEVENCSKIVNRTRSHVKRYI